MQITYGSELRPARPKRRWRVFAFMEDEIAVGAIVFGPNTIPDRLSTSGYRVAVGGKLDVSYAMGCNCIGPQCGQTKCPCVLAREAEQGRRMIDEGVTVNGKRYKLVPESPPPPKDSA